jgi:hypothetical protein
VSRKIFGLLRLLKSLMSYAITERRRGAAARTSAVFDLGRLKAVAGATALQGAWGAVIRKIRIDWVRMGSVPDLRPFEAVRTGSNPKFLGIQLIGRELFEPIGILRFTLLFAITYNKFGVAKIGFEWVRISNVLLVSLTYKNA